MRPAESGTPDSVRFALWCGLLTGLAEAAVLYIKRFLRHRLVLVGDDVFWMAPMLEAILFVAVLGVLLLVLMQWTPSWRWRVILVVLPGFSAFSVFMLWGKLHWAAALLLALGLGVRLGFWLRHRLPGLLRTVRRTTPILATAVFGAYLVVIGDHWWSDHRKPGTVTEGAPNVLLIILDTVRSLNLGLYGHERETTPGLTRWSKRGTIFERAFAPSSWTLPSHAMIFTGDWSMAARVATRVPLPGGAPTLAEVLSERGYVTGGFVANLVYTTRASGLARGFDHYEDYPRTAVEFLRSATLPRMLLDRSSWKWTTRRHPAFSWKRGDQVTEQALRWIDTRQERPWFAFLNYMEAHDPWFVPVPWDTAFGADVHAMTLDDMMAAGGSAPSSQQLDRLNRAYDGAIKYLDHEVSRLLESLEERGVLHNTIVIITSDHGEQLGDHGTVGHGTTLYRPVVQVPLLIMAPDCGVRGFRQRVPVSLADLPATIFALLGNGDGQLPGRSFKDLVCGGQRPADPILSILLVPGKEKEGFMVSVAADSLRYIRKGSGSGELYDFERDPWETGDLGGTPEGAAQVRRLNRLIDSLLPLSHP